MLMWYYTGTGCNPCISSFVVSIVFRDMPFTVYNMVEHFFFFSPSIGSVPCSVWHEV